MDSKNLISVIVPVYNGEKTLRRAVESVLCQMDGRIELILVDDGSKDESGAICDEYDTKYQNVRVVHKCNGGLSSARNAGIAAANGTYVMFLDADDYLEKTACKEVCDVIVQYAPDCIDFGWRYVSDGVLQEPAFHNLPKNTLLDEIVLRELILPPLLNLCKEKDYFIFDFACTKVFQRNILKTYAITFDESRRIWEDRPFVVHYLHYCKNYYAMDRCFYNYVYTPNSLSQRYSLDYFRIILANFNHYKELFGNQFDFDTQFVNDYWARAIENKVFQSLEQKENREQIRQNILETLQDAQVIHWFTMRSTKSDFQRKVKDAIVSGEYEKALRCYEHQNKRNSAAPWKYKAKRILKKVLGMK